MPPDLHSPRIWLRRSLFSYWFCDFFKKISLCFSSCVQLEVYSELLGYLSQSLNSSHRHVFPHIILNLSLCVSVDFVELIFLFYTISVFIHLNTLPVCILAMICDIFRWISIMSSCALYLPYFWDFHFLGPFLVHHICEFVHYTK